MTIFGKIAIYFFIKKTYEKRTSIDFHFLMVWFFNGFLMDVQKKNNGFLMVF